MIQPKESMTLFVVEDDPDIAAVLQYNLQKEGYAVKVFHEGREGFLEILKTPPHCVILDLMLPGMGGLEICRNLRAHEKTAWIPVLMVTAKGEEIDRIVGLEMGADDYLTKPFSPRELVLRVNALLKRRQASTATTLKNPLKDKSQWVFGVLQVDLDRYEVRVGKELVPLTTIEFKLLHYLYTCRGRVLMRDHLLDKVWGYDASVTSRTVDTHIKRLREKLLEAGSYIKTVRGFGYQFMDVLS